MNCPGCGKPLDNTHPLRRYHNDSCKMKAYRKRKFADELLKNKPLREP